MMAGFAPRATGQEAVGDEDARCLACRHQPDARGIEDPHDIAAAERGRQLEACHGSASGWLGPHTGGGRDGP